MIKETAGIEIDGGDYIMISSKRHSSVVLHSPSGKSSYLAFKKLTPPYHSLTYDNETRRLISEGTAAQPLSYSVFKAMGTHSLKNILTLSVDKKTSFTEVRTNFLQVPKDYVALTLTLDPALISPNLLTLTMTFMAVIEGFSSASHNSVLRNLYYVPPTIVPRPEIWTRQAKLFYQEIMRLKDGYGYFVITPI